MNIRTVTVKTIGEVVEGGWYLITGLLQDKRQTLPQIFFVWTKENYTLGLGVPYMVGDLFFWSGGEKHYRKNYQIPYLDVNIPEHGHHDVHMERILDSTINSRLREDYTALAGAQEDRFQRGKYLWLPVTDKIYAPYL